MKLPLSVVLTGRAEKALKALDVASRKRVRKKIDAVSADPLNPINSYPLQGTDKRSARVGDYRILLLIQEPNLLVIDIESRGQVYRRL